MNKNIDKNIDKNIVIKNKLVQHTVNGISRYLILWIIKTNDSIHGYGIMKELDSFFGSLIEKGNLKNAKPSKIYPILNRMEEHGLLSSKTSQKDNKKVKFYSLTEQGEFMLDFIHESYIQISKTEKGSKFYNEFVKID